jgi:UDP-3-O-[3-hydroxymyristoyl] glucosamine N-acyltransferase
VATSKTLSELAHYVGGRVIGDGNVVIHKIAPIDEAAPGEITFLAHPRYHQFLRQCRASAVIVAPGIVSDSESGSSLNYLETPNPYIGFALLPTSVRLSVLRRTSTAARSLAKA